MALFLFSLFWLEEIRWRKLYEETQSSWVLHTSKNFKIQRYIRVDHRGHNQFYWPLNQKGITSIHRT